MSTSGVLEWLLEPSQPVVRYFSLQNLLDRKQDDPEVRQAYSEIAKRGWAFEILRKQERGGYWEKQEDLYRPKYTASNWRMIVLSDFGLKYKDSQKIRKACDLFFKTWLGSEEEFRREAEVCVTGNLARFLTRFGFEDDPRVRMAFDWLVKAQKEDGGWHCFESDHGTLDCWEALAAFAALPKSKRTRKINQSIERGVEFYLERELWKEGKKYAPWFRFHYPTHYYYDLLVGLGVITSLGHAKDRRLKYALNHLQKKRRSDGKWILDAVHPDLGVGANYSLRPPLPTKFALEITGRPSKWITLQALQVMKRVEE